MRYFPILNPYTGSVNGTIFFLQVMYWYGEQKKPFYKFQNPSIHVLYKSGDSWAEELGFTESQLKSVLAKTTSKLRKEGKYDLSKCKLVLHWSVGNGLNNYCPNYPAMLSLGDATVFLESKFPHFAKWKSDFAEVGKELFKITFLHPRKFEISFSYLQKIKQYNTIKYPEKEHSSSSILKEKNLHSTSDVVILPFETERFKENWGAWKKYKASEHNFVYSAKNEQAALMPLANYDEEFSVFLIQNAIANKWKNFHFEDTPNKFLKFKNTKNHGTLTTKNGEKFEPHVASILGKYSK